ncbi:uncharacterized protein LOC143586176 [Bidens hawaiensis]|uniref:uncharacterized protein LOC143586176 n=1 Tax=Bidens hawaiensis TaxID=980011 RepID=UPI00404A506A
MAGKSGECYEVPYKRREDGLELHIRGRGLLWVTFSLHNMVTIHTICLHISFCNKMKIMNTYWKAGKKNKDKSQLVEDGKLLAKKGKAAQEKKEETPVKRTMEIPAYETNFGFKCMHYSLSELTPSTPVGSEVIDAWATILNFEEAKRSNSSRYRLFGYIGLFPQPALYGLLCDKESRLEYFKKSLRRLLEEKNEKMTLRDYELIVFPVFEEGQYF